MNKHTDSSTSASAKTGRYFKYALGEIILVVIGILIALQVNNWNIKRIEHKSEIKYLTNIKLDLQKDIIALNEQIDIRRDKINVTTSIIEHIDGIKPITELDLLAQNVYATINEERFTPNNSTYNELASSGNLSLIENDTIKQFLLDLEEHYKYNNFGIEHESFEYKEYINKSLFKYVDLNKLKRVFYFGESAKSQGLNFKHFNALLSSLEYKNGLSISNTISKSFIPLYEKIKAKSTRIINIIEDEINGAND